jgi:hypothetical protein
MADTLEAAAVNEDFGIIPIDSRGKAGIALAAIMAQPGPVFWNARCDQSKVYRALRDGQSGN